jgi:hypothetical protein
VERAAAIVGGIFIGTESSKEGADQASKIGTWCGSLVLELLAVVPLMYAMPSLFYQLAHSKLLHAVAPGSIDINLGVSELIPMVAILPFVIYQLAGFGTLDYIVSKPVNWTINLSILGLIIAGYVANREGAFRIEKRFAVILAVIMALTVLYGILKLKQMQTTYDAQCPPKASKQ